MSSTTESSSSKTRGPSVEERARLSTQYRRLARHLYLWSAVRIPRALWHRLHPEDLLQEIWCRAVEAFPRHREERASFRTWIFGIAHKTLAENLRNLHVRRREQAFPQTAGASAGEEDFVAEVTTIVRSLIRKERYERLLAAIADLPQEDRQLVLFRALEGLSHHAVGERLGLSESACEIRWRRLRGRLRRRLREDSASTSG